MNANMPVQRLGSKNTMASIWMTIFSCNTVWQPMKVSLEVDVLRSITSYVKKHGIVLVNNSHRSECVFGWQLGCRVGKTLSRIKLSYFQIPDLPKLGDNK